MTCLVKYFKWLLNAKVNYFLHQTTKCTKCILQAQGAAVGSTKHGVQIEFRMKTVG